MRLGGRVREWLEQHPGKKLCDSCLAKKMGVAGRRPIWKVSKLLASEHGFHREKANCPGCGDNRLLIWTTGNSN